MAKLTPDDLDQAAEQFTVLNDAVFEEAAGWREQMDATNPNHRRAYVRAAFAFVEATAFGIRQYVLMLHERLGVKLPASHIASLAEETYSINDDGTVRVRAQFNPTLNAMRFTFRIVGEVFGEPLKIDYGGKGWAAFREAVGIRNRLAHPKKPDEFAISEEDLAAVEVALGWFRAAGIEFFRVTKEGAGRVLQQQETESREFLASLRPEHKENTGKT